MPTLRFPAEMAPVAVGAAALAGCALVAVVDPNRTQLFPACPFRSLTRLDCPGCGATRALHALTQGALGQAVGLNLLVVLLVPLAVWAWVGWLARTQGWSGPELGVPPSWAMRAIPVVLVGFWVLRNLPVAPVSALGT